MKKGFSVEGFMADIERFDREISAQQEPTGILNASGEAIVKVTPEAPKGGSITINTEEEPVDDMESSPFIDRRLGTFAIPLEWLEGMQQKDSEQVFKDFRIISANYDYATGCIQYTAASFHFDPLPPNTQAPGYVIMVDAESDVVSIRVKRV